MKITNVKRKIGPKCQLNKYLGISEALKVKFWRSTM